MEAKSIAVVAVFCAAVALIVSAVALGLELRPEHDSQTSAPPSAPPAAATTTQVTEQEYTIDVANASAPAGPVTFHVANQGSARHQLVVMRTDIAEGSLPLAPDGTVNEQSSGITVEGSAADIESGATADVTTTLAPGHYVLICNISGHYAAGMHRSFTVA